MSFQEKNEFDIIMSTLKNGRIESRKQLDDFIDYTLPDVIFPDDLKKVDRLLDVLDDDIVQSFIILDEKKRKIDFMKKLKIYLKRFIY